MNKSLKLKTKTIIRNINKFVIKFLIFLYYFFAGSLMIVLPTLMIASKYPFVVFLGYSVLFTIFYFLIVMWAETPEPEEQKK